MLVERWRSLLRSNNKTKNSSGTYPVSFAHPDLSEDTVYYPSWKRGLCCLVSSLRKKLGVASIISESLSLVPNKSFVARLIETMIVNRLEDPCSKLKLLE